MAGGILLILLLAAVAVICIVLAANWNKKKAAQRKRHEEQVKLQILNQSLKNVMRGDEVLALGEGTGSQEGAGGQMLKLLVDSGGSKKEYVLNPRQRLVLGSQGDCTIQLTGSGIGSRQCEFFVYHEAVYVKNLNILNNTVIVRGNKRAQVDNAGLRVCSGDVIAAGPCRMTVELLNFAGKTM